MSNYSLATADRLTHVKIVTVALIACAVVIGVGKTARLDIADKNARMEVRTQVMVANKPVQWTSADRVAIR